MLDERLEQRTLVERANQHRDHVHQLDLLPLHVAWEQFSCIGGELEEPAVTQVGDVATHRPHRIERFSDKVDLLGRHDRIAAICTGKSLRKPAGQTATHASGPGYAQVPMPGDSDRQQIRHVRGHLRDQSDYRYEFRLHEGSWTRYATSAETVHDR